ncbi:hypothetical protein KR059_012800 [Drosophila kikkawai]|nr:hypothetical protein KR059_012800 [Drosophila kikkawai]
MKGTQSSLLTVRMQQKPTMHSARSTMNDNYLENGDEGAAAAANATVDSILKQVLSEEAHLLNASNSSMEQLDQVKCSRIVVAEDLVMDPRLLAWNRVLEQRRRLQKRIERETGKRPEDVLFNRPTTIDEASKRMILRVLDTADRSRPQVRVQEDSMLGTLKARCEPELCREIRELYAAKPQLQPVEFVGLPQVTQEELTATATATESQWHRSEILGQRIQSNKQSIQNVLEFAPELEKLQIVPTNVETHAKMDPITMIGVDHMQAISEDSTQEDDEDSEAEMDAILQEWEEEDGPADIEVTTATKEVGKEQVEVTDLDEYQTTDGVMINGCLYDYREMKGPNRKGIQLLLKCDPHQRVVKTLVDIQNLSQKLLHVYWASRNRSRTDHQPMEGELVFDRCEFILEPKSRRQIRVLYHPQVVGLTTQRWSLCLVKSPVCGTRRLMVIIQGMCTMPDPYLRRLQNHRQVPGDKQQLRQANSILKVQASLAPIIENPPLMCPYQRILDERELFNSENPSYRCERYADLEALKDLYALAKKPRDRPWDLSIESLRRSISRRETRLLRESLHNKLVDLLQPMKCNRGEALIRMEHNPERDRACFIYVRGTISSAIEEWEKMALGLDEQFFKMELLRQQRQEQENKEIEENPRKTLQFQDLLELPEELKTIENVSRRTRSNKYLKDSLYMHTYNLLCDAAEDIVSVIESTSHL